MSKEERPDTPTQSPKMFSLTRSIIHDCPAIVIDDSLVNVGKTARIIALKGATQEDAALIVDALRATRCKESGHVWVGTGDDRVVCGDCDAEKGTVESEMRQRAFEEKPVAWMVKLKSGVESLVYDIDRLELQEGDFAYPLFREVYTQAQLDAAKATAERRHKKLRIE